MKLKKGDRILIIQKMANTKLTFGHKYLVSKVNTYDKSYTVTNQASGMQTKVSIKWLDSQIPVNVKIKNMNENQVKLSSLISEEKIKLNEDIISAIQQLLNDKTIIYVAGEAMTKGEAFKAFLIGSGFGVASTLAMAAGYVRYLMDLAKKKGTKEVVQQIKTAKKGEKI